MRCVTLDLEQPEQYRQLQETLSRTDINRVYYLATGSELYTRICAGLHHSGLILPGSKIVLEKPIGHDFASAQAINAAVAEYFTEPQIYRIDHYLGKETVQNLLVLRFANSLFEQQWNQKYIDHIQITISESVGCRTACWFL